MIKPIPVRITSLCLGLFFTTTSVPPSTSSLFPGRITAEFRQYVDHAAAGLHLIAAPGNITLQRLPNTLIKSRPVGVPSPLPDNVSATCNPSVSSLCPGSPGIQRMANTLTKPEPDQPPSQRPRHLLRPYWLRLCPNKTWSSRACRRPRPNSTWRCDSPAPSIAASLRRRSNLGFLLFLFCSFQTRSLLSQI